MIVDASALLAVLFDEADAEKYEQKIAEAMPCRMSVANLLEAAFVVESRLNQSGSHILDAYVSEAEIELVPVTMEQMQAARLAWRRLGKGSHPAALNFGDCFAYALAEVACERPALKGTGLRAHGCCICPIHRKLKTIQ